MPSQTTRSSENTRKGRRRKPRSGITYRGQKSTHDTDGLEGFPAVDIFAKPGTPFLAPENGRVVRLSGRGGTSGQVYGYSIYFIGESGRVYFITHLGYRRAPVGAYKQGAVLGTVSAWSGGSPHAHVGINDSGYNPGSGDTSGAPPAGSPEALPQMPVPNAPQLPEPTSNISTGPPPPNAPPMPSAPMPGLPGETVPVAADDISEQWRRIASQPFSSPEARRFAGLEL